MQPSYSWEANSSANSHKILRILWKPKVLCSQHTPFVPVLSQINPVRVPDPPSWRSILILSFPSTSRSSKWSSFPLLSAPKSCMHLSSSHMCYMSHPSYYSRSNYPKNIWSELQNMKLLIVQFYTVPCHLVSLRPKYLPQHHNLEPPQPIFLPQYERSSFTPAYLRVTYQFLRLFS